MRFWKISALVLFATFFVFLCTTRAFAFGETSVHFNEIMWRGSEASTADEWVELFNDSEDVVDLAGWQVFDEVKGETVLPISGQISPHGYFLISNNAKDHKFTDGESILNIDPDMPPVPAISLSNSKFKISLRDAGGRILDLAGDGKEPFYGEYKSRISSMQRVKYDVSGDQEHAWRSSMEAKNLDSTSTSFGTPKTSGKTLVSLDLENNKIELGRPFDLKLGYEFYDPEDELENIGVTLQDESNILFQSNRQYGNSDFRFSALTACPQVLIEFKDDKGIFFSRSYDLVCYQKSQQVRFYEALPHPSKVDWNGDSALDTKDEWLELVNFSNSDVDLSGWSIQDLSEKKFTIKDKKIVAQGFLPLFGTETGISLNDSGETIFLYDPGGILMDKIEIPSSSSKKDLSYAFWGSGWYFTVTPTLGNVNAIKQTGSAKYTSYDKGLEGKEVGFTGQIVEVDRDSVCLVVRDQFITVKLNGSPDILQAGQVVSVKGRVTNSSTPIIVASPADFVVLHSSSVLKPLPILDAIKEEEEKRIVVTKTTKIKNKFSLSYKPKLNPLVLGDSSTRSSVNYEKILLYFIGIFSFLTIILIYDFCCRE